jgi:general secretion pathway protein E
MNQTPFTPAMIQKAQIASKRSGRKVLSELEDIAKLDVRQVVQSVAGLLGWRVIETYEMFKLTPAFDLLPLSKAMQRNCLLMRHDTEGLLGIMADPFDTDLSMWLEVQARAPISYRLSLSSDIAAYISKTESSAKALDHMVADSQAPAEDGKRSSQLSFASASESTSPAVKLVNSTLYDALKAGASDIHLECTPQGLTIKYRVDGVLDLITHVSGIENAEQVVSRLKVLSELDISERRIPQDGSFRVDAAGSEVDMRLSIMPSIHGEDAVIRILDKRAMVQANGSLTMESLGFEDSAVDVLRQLAREPYGMLLVTGPTGSGKTTTLYAALTEINNGRDKIITIEDPVEYQLPGILQIPVNEKKGLSFAKGLRSILRHDPDKIMVGEIRDRETAEIAVQSALTGHLVLTTVHANNVFDVFGRFTHMGIDPYAFVSALNGIWAQRLVRTICPHCVTNHLPSLEDLTKAQLRAQDVPHYDFKHGLGCGDCRGTGFKGRMSIAEILLLNDEIRELIVEKKPIRMVKEAARLNGTRSLREAGLRLVMHGKTTLQEIMRVTLNA